MVTIGSLFDGISGFPLAGERVGMKSLWASEIEPFPIKVSSIRFPDMEQMGDITKLNGAELETVDTVTGGSPCQDLSVAGKRAGLAGARSGLFMEQIRIIKELRNKNGKSSGTNGLIRPRFMVWENVPGAFSSNKGEDFRAVLEETARIADETITIPKPPKGKWNTFGVIMGNGWSIAWRVLDAQYWGVPQRRRRIFLVADFGGQSAPEILFKREGLSRHTKKSSKEGEGTSTDAERSVNKASWDCRGNGSGGGSSYTYRRSSK
jgi:DNA (cytosine-5)-methyltransferase 1